MVTLGVENPVDKKVIHEALLTATTKLCSRVRTFFTKLWSQKHEALVAQPYKQ